MSIIEVHEKGVRVHQKEPVIEVSMKVLGYSVKLEGGRKITINELIADANKKKRKTKAKK